MKIITRHFGFVFLLGIASAVAGFGAPQSQFSAVVSDDGPKMQHSLQDAIAAAPENSTRPFRIFLKPGRYQGQLIVPKNKSRIELVGETAEKTIITYALNQNEALRPGGQPLFNNASAVILGDDFRAENITFENTFGDHVQALALRVDGDRAVFKHCRFLGWQDTVLLNRGRQYFANCYLEGRVDFIYGGATTVFEHCQIHSKNGGFVTAASTPQDQPFGFVFLNCTLTGDPKPWANSGDADARTKPKSRPMAYLGRPWRPYASVTYLNCEIGDHIKPEGWENWRNPANEQTVRFGEYNSTGPGANPRVRVKWAKPLTKEEADRITIETVLRGNDHWDLLRVPDGPATPTSIAPALPAIPARIVNIKDFGAVGDGVADETKVIQAAIRAAGAQGGGTVVVPVGVFLSGPLQMLSRTNLRLEEGVTLRMLPLDKYPGGTINPPDFISGSKLHDVAISGAGTIDGQGAAWWPLAKSKDATRPRMIALSGCERVLIEKVKLTNSPMFHIAIGGKSSNVTVRGVTIRAPASTDPVTPSHNTDACDVSGKHVLIEDCDVSVGDDDFTCGGGTSDVLIRNCKYGHGHGLSIGSPTHGGVSNITVENCTFKDTDCGIRIKSDRDRGGLVENLTYRNLRMTNVGYPILIYGAYMAKQREYRNLNALTPAVAASYPAQPLAAGTPVFRHITFSNITATVQSGHRAGLIWGLPEAPVANVLLENVVITADKPFGLYNAQDVRLVNCKITTPDGVNELSLTNARMHIASH